PGRTKPFPQLDRQGGHVKDWGGPAVIPGSAHEVPSITSTGAWFAPSARRVASDEDADSPVPGGHPMAMTTRAKMARAEAGRKGGLATKQRHGREFFGRIGRIGGKKGGDTTKRRYGVEFYQRIGRKGGSR